MELLKQPGGHIWIADAPNWTGDARPHLTIGISPQAVQRASLLGLRWTLGQMYGIVATGLIFAEHVFQGLRRDMYVRHDKEAAKRKFAVTWAAKRDAQLVGDKSAPTLQYTDAPPNRVFVVLISPNEKLEDFPDIFGWAERWTWVAADADLRGAPIDWNKRYDERIWSSGGR